MGEIAEQITDARAHNLCLCRCCGGDQLCSPDRYLPVSAPGHCQDRLLLCAHPAAVVHLQRCHRLLQHRHLLPRHLQGESALPGRLNWSLAAAFQFDTHGSCKGSGQRWCWMLMWRLGWEAACPSALQQAKSSDGEHCVQCHRSATMWAWEGGLPDLVCTCRPARRTTSFCSSYAWGMLAGPAWEGLSLQSQISTQPIMLESLIQCPGQGWSCLHGRLTCRWALIDSRVQPGSATDCKLGGSSNAARPVS